jgi:hypothetical protein
MRFSDSCIGSDITRVDVDGVSCFVNLVGDWFKLDNGMKWDVDVRELVHWNLDKIGIETA